MKTKKQQVEQRPHVMDKTCWCNPTVEYVPPKGKSK